MATLTASQNPVGIYSPRVPVEIAVNWDTSPFLTLAKLHLSTNGGLPQEIPGQPALGAFSGAIPKFAATLPNSYKVLLLSEPGRTELASLVVETYDIRQDLAESFSASYRPQLRPQLITNLSVRPGIDVVLVTFRTSKPTIPLVELRDANGVKIDARFPLFGGMQTEHQAFFGEDRPLALESKHSIRIVAAGGAKEVEVTAEFITGSRKAEVVFDEMDIFDDSDPGLRGEGEFRFSFGAGDALTGESLGEPWPRFGEIGLDPDDDHVPINRTITILQAPRLLWVQTIAFESDLGAWPPEWFGSFGSVPGFSSPGTQFTSDEGHQEVTVTAFVDIDHDVGAATTPFELNPGNYSIAFVMKGHVAVESKFGQALTTKSGKKRPRPKAVGPLHEAGTTAFVAPAWGVEDAQMFAYGPDNSVYHRAVAKPARKPGGEDWTRVELPSAGRPTIAATSAGTFDMILHRDDGGVMHSRKSGKAKQGAWRSLGGDFEQMVVASDPAKPKAQQSDLTIFGLGKDGGLMARGLDGGDWQRVGDAPATAIALADMADGPALLSIGSDRRLRVFVKRSGRWRAHDLAPTVPGRDRLARLAVATVGAPGEKTRAQSLVIGAMSDDDRVRILHWPDFPSGTPESGWEDAGSLQDLFTGPRRGAKRSPAAKPGAAGARKATAKTTRNRAKG